jgi:hypothetical protein
MMRISVVFVLALLSAATVHAGFTPAVAPWGTVQEGDVIRFNRAAGSGPGGEYVVYSTVPNPKNPSSRIVGNSLFDTFCLERNEYLNFSGDFIVDDLSRESRNGGMGGQNSSGVADPLDPRTAYLYEQFYFQRLSGYDFKNTGDRNANADQLQNAIWFLENELTGKGATGESLNYMYDPTDMTIAEKTLGKDSRAYHWIFEADKAVRDGTCIGEQVRVVNLLDNHHGRAQDVLAVAIPEPGSLFIWGVLFGTGAYWALRKGTVPFSSNENRDSPPPVPSPVPRGAALPDHPRAL